ncbi:MAG: DHH family phosphoesterase, partial [Armatimonadota bacterium]|nr:DHH family phosphoesterase [Armatimonadota bacterium]
MSSITNKPPLNGWILPAPLPDHLAARFPRACRPLLQALQTRGILNGSTTGPAGLTEFFDTAAPSPDPFQLLDMDRAVERILKEVHSGRAIGVFGHFDCDGVTSTALLTEALLLLGAPVVPHIPDRNDDYGIPANGVDRLAAAGVRLIVTVDCGIKAIAEVDRATSLGIDIVITDHHQCGQQRLPSGEEVEVLPAACAVVNPRRAGCPYPFKRLAGVGVVFRLVQALAQAAGKASLDASALENFLDLVCIGTTADVVDLVGENR